MFSFWSTCDVFFLMSSETDRDRDGTHDRTQDGKETGQEGVCRCGVLCAVRVLCEKNPGEVLRPQWEANPL